MKRKFYETWWFITILVVSVTAICLAVIIPIVSMTVAQDREEQAAKIYQPSGDSKQTEQSKPASAPTLEPFISITIPDLFAEYDKNKVAADEKYKGRVLQLTGIVTDINKTFTGKPTIGLEGVGVLSSVNCDFSQDYIPDIAALNKGDTITVQGDCDGIMLGIINLDNCKIVK